MNENAPPRFTQLPAEQFNDTQKRVAERVLKIIRAPAWAGPTPS